MQSLYSLQYSMVYEDAISQLYICDAKKESGIVELEARDVHIESFISWMKFSSGDSLLLFHPIDWPDQKTKRKTLERYNSFLSKVNARKGIPHNEINCFKIEFVIDYDGECVLDASYTLKYHSDELVIDKKRICYIHNN